MATRPSHCASRSIESLRNSRPAKPPPSSVRRCLSRPQHCPSNSTSSPARSDMCRLSSGLGRCLPHGEHPVGAHPTHACAHHAHPRITRCRASRPNILISRGTDRPRRGQDSHLDERLLRQKRHRTRRRATAPGCFRSQALARKVRCPCK